MKQKKEKRKDFTKRKLQPRRKEKEWRPKKQKKRDLDKKQLSKKRTDWQWKKQLPRLQLKLLLKKKKDKG